MATDPDRATAIDLVIQPAVLDQLARMADGYDGRDGTTVEAGKDGRRGTPRPCSDRLASSRDAPDVQISAMPFSAPLIPSLLANGLVRRPRATTHCGRRDRRDRTWGRRRDRSDAATPRGPRRARRSTTLAAGAASHDPRRRRHGGSARPAQRVRAARRPPPWPRPTGTRCELVLPDPAPRRCSRTPACWRTRSAPRRSCSASSPRSGASPVPAASPTARTVRGIALALPAGLPAGIWGPITRRLADAPFLRAAHATGLRATGEPARPAGDARRTLRRRVLPRLRRRDPRRAARRRGVSIDARRGGPDAGPCSTRPPLRRVGRIHRRTVGELEGRAGSTRSTRSPRTSSPVPSRRPLSGLHVHVGQGHDPAEHGRSRRHAAQDRRAAPVRRGSDSPTGESRS